MIEGKFNEKDKEKVITFLNFVATNAVFGEMRTEKMIEYVRLLSHMQSIILPKIEKNILEIVEVIEPKKDEDE